MRPMRIALIADAYPPLKSSGAVQLRDLTIELAKQGHNVTMMVAAPELDVPFRAEDWRGVCVLRLKTPKTKDVSYVRRTINEFLMPFAMLRNLRKSPLASVRWDGVAWYSPTIFLGPMVSKIKRASVCRSYLIIRDIFPEWAADMGLMGRGLPYRIFKAVANYQYSVADVVGVLTKGNLSYFMEWGKHPNRRVEVLHNWLADAPDIGSSIAVADGKLAGRTIFVYAGNMGVAQGMEVLIDLADRLQYRNDIGFLFVGRGSQVSSLKIDVLKRGLNNVDFVDEIEPEEISGLYAQCHVGLVTLDPRHKTHNIPGKFLSYMQSGLPVLACINPGNDLVELIEREKVGRVCTKPSAGMLEQLVDSLIHELKHSGPDLSDRCKALSAKMFSPEIAAKKIVAGLID